MWCQFTNFISHNSPTQARLAGFGIWLVVSHFSPESDFFLLEYLRLHLFLQISPTKYPHQNYWLVGSQGFMIQLSPSVYAQNSPKKFLRGNGERNGGVEEKPVKTSLWWERLRNLQWERMRKWVCNIHFKLIPALLWYFTATLNTLLWLHPWDFSRILVRIQVSS